MADQRDSRGLVVLCTRGAFGSALVAVSSVPARKSAMKPELSIEVSLKYLKVLPAGEDQWLRGGLILEAREPAHAVQALL